SVDAGPRHVPSGGKPGMLGEPGRGPYKGSRSGGERSGEVLDRLAEAPAEGGRDHREEHRGQEAVDLDHDLYGEQRAVTFRFDVDTDRPAQVRGLDPPQDALERAPFGDGRPTHVGAPAHVRLEVERLEIAGGIAFRRQDPVDTRDFRPG